jgi:hypothetical protein
MTAGLVAARAAALEVMGFASTRADRGHGLIRRFAVLVLVLGGVGLALVTMAGAPLVAPATSSSAVTFRAIELVAAASGLVVLYLVELPRFSRVSALLAVVPASRVVRATTRGVPLLLVFVGNMLVVGPLAVVQLGTLLGLSALSTLGLALGSTAAGLGGSLAVRVGLGRLAAAGALTPRLLAPIGWLAVLAGVHAASGPGLRAEVVGLVTRPDCAAALTILGAIIAAVLLASVEGSAPRRAPDRARREWRSTGRLPWFTLELVRTSRVPHLRSLVLQCLSATAVIVALVVLDLGGTAALLAGHGGVLIAACWAHPIVSALRWVRSRTPYGVAGLSEFRHIALVNTAAVVVCLPWVAASGLALAWAAGDGLVMRDVLCLWSAAAGLAGLVSIAVRGRALHGAEAFESLILGAIYLTLAAVSIGLGSLGLERAAVDAVLAVLGIGLHLVPRLVPPKKSVRIQIEGVS